MSDEHMSLLEQAALKPYISFREAMAFFSVSRRHLSSILGDDGGGVALRVGGRWVISKELLKERLDDRCISGGSDD